MRGRPEGGRGRERTVRPGPARPPAIRTRAAVSAAALLLLVAPAPGAGQETVDALRPGDRVRVWAPFVGLTGREATVADPPAGRVLRMQLGERLRDVPLEEIEQMDVRRRTGNHLGEGALLGGSVGAVAATLFVLPFCGDSDTVCEADEVLRAVVLVGVPPLALGSLLGLALGRHEWVRVELQAVPGAATLSPRPAPGLRAGWSIPVP